MQEDIEKRVSDLESKDREREAVSLVLAERRAELDKDLSDAIKALREEVHELKNWKMKLQYPFVIVGVVFVGFCSAIGAYLFKIFNGD